MSLLAVLPLWPSRLAIIISPWEFGHALTGYRTGNFPQTTPIVGSRISYQAHYNEFVESGSKSWALMRRWLVLGMKSTPNQAAQRLKEKGPLARGRGCAIPSRSFRRLLPFSRPLLFFVRSLLLYIILLCSSSSYTYQSSKPILKCMSHRPSFLALCGLLWPLLFCLGVTSTSTGSECQLWVFNMEVMTPPGVVSPPSPYGQPIGPGISFAILEWTASNDVAFFSPMNLACRGYGCARQYNLKVWILFICPRAFLTPQRGPQAWYLMGRNPQILWPHIYQYTCKVVYTLHYIDCF